MKYDNMLLRNKRVNKEKKEKALSAIRKLLADQETISATVLSQRTGLSRGFFYYNPELRQAMSDAREQQKGLKYTRPQKVLFDKAMSAQLEILQCQLEKERENARKVQEENEKLQRALKKKSLGMIKSL